MALVIPPGFAQVSAVLRNVGDPEAWYVTWAVDASGYGGDYEALGDLNIGAFSVGFLNSMNAATTLEGVIMRVGQDGGEPLSVYRAAGVTGSGSTAKLPQNCAMLVRKNTGRGGRTGKGRMYIPNVLSEGEVDNVGVIAPSFLSGLQTGANDFLEFLNEPEVVAPAPMVLLHNEGVPGGTTPTAITSLQVDSVIATQRRRLRR